MTTHQSSAAAGRSLGRDALYAARYYLGNRWTLVALGALAVVLGLTFGGGGWLVAAGLAPVILSTLPCLIMCGLGACMMCRSGKRESVQSPGAVDTATSASALGTAKMDGPAIAGASCCHEANHGNPATALAEDSATEWKEKPHA